MPARLTIIAAAAAFAGGALLSACTTAQDAPAVASAGAAGKSCFYRSEVTGFNPVRHQPRGSGSIIVHVGANKSYLFETLGPCPDINWTEAIGFDQHGPGQICDGLDVDLIVPGTIGPQRCAVKMIRPLSREEARSY